MSSTQPLALSCPLFKDRPDMDRDLPKTPPIPDRLGRESQMSGGLSVSALTWESIQFPNTWVDYAEWPAPCVCFPNPPQPGRPPGLTPTHLLQRVGKILPAGHVPPKFLHLNHLLWSCCLSNFCPSKLIYSLNAARRETKAMITQITVGFRGKILMQMDPVSIWTTTFFKQKGEWKSEDLWFG